MTHETTDGIDKIDALLRLMSRVGRLAELPRMGWVVSGVPQPESVGAHVYEVAIIALWLSDSLAEPVDVESVLRIALLHDVGEALLTDLPAPVKALLGRDSVAAAEYDATKTVLGDAPAGWMEDVQSYQKKHSIEARIVKAADRIQMMIRALQYEVQGRGDVRRFWQLEFDDCGIPLVGEILSRIREHRDRGTWYPSDFD